MIDEILKLAEARDTPCERFECPARQACKANLACNAFAIYVDTGRVIDPLRFALPNALTFKRINAERTNGSRMQAYKRMVVDDFQAWDREFGSINQQGRK